MFVRQSASPIRVFATLVALSAVWTPIRSWGSATNAPATSPRESLRQANFIDCQDRASGKEPAASPSGDPESDVDARLKALIGELNPPTVEEIVAAVAPIPTLDEALASASNLGTARTVEEVAADTTDRVSELSRQIPRLRAQGDYEAARAVAEELHIVREQRQGAEHWETLDAWRLAETLRQIERMPGDARERLTRAYRVEAEASELFDQGRYLEASRLVQWQLLTRLELLDRNHPEVARSMSDLGMYLESAGEYAPSGLLLRQAVAIRLRALGVDHLLVALDLNRLARHVRKIDGPLYLQESLWHKALGLGCKLLGEEQVPVLIIMENLASVLVNKGEYATAERLYRRIFAATCKQRGEGHRSVARLLDHLAGLLAARGDYATAEVLCRRVLALEIERSQWDYDSPALASSWSTLGTLLFERGDAVSAEAALRQAVGIYKRHTSFGDGHPHTLHARFELAKVQLAQGNVGEAENAISDVLAFWRGRSGPPGQNLATSLDAYAMLLLERGDYGGAARARREALVRYRSKLGDLHPYVGNCLSNLAHTYRIMGDTREAMRKEEEALKIRHDALGEGHPRVVESLYRLACIYEDLGMYGRAKGMLLQAAEGFESARCRTSVFSFERVPYATSSSPLPSLSAYLARDGDSSEAWKWLEASLGRGLWDSVSARHLRPLTVEERARGTNLRGRICRLDERISLTPKPGMVTSPHRAGIEELRNERAVLLADLAEHEMELLSSYGVAAGRVYGLETIQGELRPDVALVAWIDVAGHHRKFDPGGHHWACVVRHRGEPVWAKLPGTGKDATWTPEDDERPKRLREALSVGRANRGAVQDEVLPLYEQRLAPLDPYLDGVRHLVVLPAGRMAGVPVGLLSDNYMVSYAPSGTMYAWLVNKGRQSRKQAKPQRLGRLLALGDPVFTRPEGPTTTTSRPPDHGVLVVMVVPDSNAADSGLREGDVLLSYDREKLEGPSGLGLAIQRGVSAQTTGSDSLVSVSVWRDGEVFESTVRPGRLGVRLSHKPALEVIRAQQDLGAALRAVRESISPPLPATRREIEVIATLFEGTRNGAPSTVLLGANASEQELDRFAVMGKLRDYGFLHLATHAVMNDQVAMLSALILSQDQLSDPLDAVTAGTEVYDGRLTAEQIVRTWKLDADLVTLSACETALGKASGGEGYLGFAQALLVAGARSLLLSLWKVDDTATTLLMTRFYENLIGQYSEPRQGHATGTPMGKAEALWEAKHWLRGLSPAEARAALVQLGFDSSVCDAAVSDNGRERAKVSMEPPGASIQRRDNPCDFSHPYYWAAFILIGDPG